MQTNISKPLSLLILTLSDQVSLLKEFIHTPSPTMLEVLKSREEKINNEKVVIENICYQRLTTKPLPTKKEITFLRATITIVANLEHIGDLCMGVASQMAYFKYGYTSLFPLKQKVKKEKNFLFFAKGEKPLYLIDKMLDLLTVGIQEITPAWHNPTIDFALPICRAEYEIDNLYSQEFQRILEKLNMETYAGDYVTALFIFNYIERMGDQLQNIGEALMLASMGEKIKIAQFETLQKALEQSGQDISLNDLRYQGIWGTKSGCRVAKVRQSSSAKKESFQENLQNNSSKNSQEGSLIHELLHKDGTLTKLKKEKLALEHWRKLFPDLVPKVFAYTEDNERASLLMEFLHGYHFEKLIFNCDKREYTKAVNAFINLTNKIRKKTYQNGKTKTSYIKQIQKRLHEVRLVHPNFIQENLNINGTKKTFSETLELCEVLETSLPAPFSVLIHGDCNANNIIWNTKEKAIYFIDLHRSKQADYVQDVSTFIVSYFRQVQFKKKNRTRINNVIEMVYHENLKYAEKMNDKTYLPRLTLSLARSFFTSTRFELDSVFSKHMCQVSFRLLEHILNFTKDNFSETLWEEYTFPQEVLYIQGDLLKKFELSNT